METAVGHYDALRHLREARDLAERFDYAWLAAWFQVYLGILAMARGRLEDAWALLDEGLDLSVAVRSVRCLTLCLAAFAQLAFAEGMLVLADRLFTGAALWRKAQATGAALLWRVVTGTKTASALPVDRVLADGSWLSRLDPDQVVGAPIVVGVLEYTIDDPGRPQAAEEVYRLVTTILDPTQAPARELAALDQQRWAVEGVLDELKTHQHGHGMVLRSQGPCDGSAGGLGAPAGPLRHPYADAPGRPDRGPGP